MKGTRRTLALIAWLSLTSLLVGACVAIPSLIEREAGWLAITEPGWQFEGRESLRHEQTQNVLGTDVTVRVTAHTGLWTSNQVGAIVTAAIPSVERFGLQLNPVAMMDVEQLADFVLTAVISQAQGLLPFGAMPTLGRQEDVTFMAPFATLTGAQFQVTAPEAPVELTALLVKARSRNDIVIVLGLLPHPLRDSDRSAFEAAVASSQHQDAPPVQP